MNEIHILRHFKHSTLIPIYEVFESEQHINVVMEHLKGGELFDKVMAKGNYIESDARTIMRDIMESMQFCHERGILHRDLKPENIILM